MNDVCYHKYQIISTENNTLNNGIIWSKGNTMKQIACFRTQSSKMLVIYINNLEGSLIS